MSIRLLSKPKATMHELADDIESFLYVLCWVVLRFTPTRLSSDKLSFLLSRVFDYLWAYSSSDGSLIGGQGKMGFLSSGEMMSESVGLPKGPLHNLITTLSNTCAMRYKRTPSKEEQAMHETLRDLKKIPPRSVYLKLLKAAWVADWEQAHSNLQDPKWLTNLFNVAVSSTDWLSISQKGENNPLPIS